MKNLKFTYLLLSLVFIISCSKDDDVDKPSDKFDGSKRALEEFYNPELVKALNDLGFTAQTGTTPPNIEGTFLVTPFNLKATSVPNDHPIGKQFSDYTLNFSSQNNNKALIDYNGSGGGQTDVGKGSIISGNGSNFSVYLKTTSKIGDFTAHSAIVMSGKITDSGINNFQFATLMLDDKGAPKGTFAENNTGRLFIDGDGLVSKVTTKASIITERNNKVINAAALGSVFSN